MTSGSSSERSTSPDPHALPNARRFFPSQASTRPRRLSAFLCDIAYSTRASPPRTNASACLLGVRVIKLETLFKSGLRTRFAMEHRPVQVWADGELREVVGGSRSDSGATRCAGRQRRCVGALHHEPQAGDSRHAHCTGREDARAEAGLVQILPVHPVTHPVGISFAVEPGNPHNDLRRVDASARGEDLARAAPEVSVLELADGRARLSGLGKG